MTQMRMKYSDFMFSFDGSVMPARCGRAVQINGQAVAMAMDAENKPWIHLAGALGRLLRQLAEDRVSPTASLSIITRGTVDSVVLTLIILLQQFNSLFI